MTPGAGKGSADYRHHTTMGLADYRRAGSSEGYLPEGAVMLQKCQAFRKHEAPGRGAGHQEEIGANKKPPENSSTRSFPAVILFIIKFFLTCTVYKSDKWFL